MLSLKTISDWTLRLYRPDASSSGFIDPEALGFSPFMEGHTEILRRDVLAFARHLAPRPVSDAVAIPQIEAPLPDAWMHEILYVLGEHNQAFQQRCPQAHAVIQQLCMDHPNVQYVGVSTMHGRTAIEPHQDYNPLVLRYHLPLVCEPGQATLTVGGETRCFEEGKGLLFDFSVWHHSENAGDTGRINLMIDVWRPELMRRLGPLAAPAMTGLAAVLRRGVPAARTFRRSMPQYDDARIEDMVQTLDCTRLRNQRPIVLARLASLKVRRLRSDRRAIMRAGETEARQLGLTREQVVEYADMLCMAIYADWAGACMYTMLTRAGLDNVVACCSRVIADGVKGAFLEAGVWRGGAGILMRHVSVVRRDAREVFLLDSFYGMEDITDAPPQAENLECDVLCSRVLGHAEHHFGRPVIHTSEQLVRDNIVRLLGGEAGFTLIKGWFSPDFPWDRVPTLAVLRLDCDYYVPTRLCLEALYDKVAPGGCVILDEYYLEHMGEGRAVDEFREARGITDPIVRVDGNSGYWIKLGAPNG
jgi:hypothetical protein